MTEQYQNFDFTHLTVAERILLAESLWDSVLETPEAVVLTEEQCKELDRRVAALDAGEVSSAPWPEVRQRLQSKE